ncbi:YgjP-like metallopeptidase domain-containing protein [Leptospirillum ferriphilum]|nr:YgjP-like metallopeptidase domain-containing protein [Leptospirillum ferriphilum]
MFLHVPRGTASKTIDQILHRHRRWIQNRLSRPDLKVQFPEKNHEMGNPFLSPDPFFMDGIPFYLAWEKKEQTEIVIDRHNRLLLLKSTEEKKKDFQIIITQWAIHSFFSTIRSILNSYKKTLGIQPQKVFVRPTRSQWGSMSKNRNMSLSWSLFAFEEKILRYIILHELAHIPFPNHSQQFWNFIQKKMPDYRQIKKDLLNSYPSPRWLDPFQGNRRSLELPNWKEDFRNIE